MEPWPPSSNPHARRPSSTRRRCWSWAAVSAGVAAAVAAARRGADVLLVERHGYLGGLATGGLIILLLTLDDGRGRQAVAGLCHEAVGLLDARGAAFHPGRDEWGSDDPALVGRDQRWGLVWGRAPTRASATRWPTTRPC